MERVKNIMIFMILSIKMAEVTIVSVVQILKNYSSSENSSFDEKYESLQQEKKKRVKRPRIENYTLLSRVIWIMSSKIILD